MRPILRTLLAASLIVSTALADKIILKDGRKYEGRIVSQDEHEVKIDLGKNGAAITFQMALVEKVERTAGSASQLYEGRLLITDAKDADSLVVLADWCVANELKDKAAKHYIEALALRPEHIRARGRLAELGYKQVDGAWLSKEEQEKLANPPVEPVKPEVNRGPTSEDVARDRGKSVVAVWSRSIPGVGVWAAAEGILWVAGPPADNAEGGEVDLGDRRVAARVLARDKARQIAIWKCDVTGVLAARPSFEPLPEKDPLVALAPGGIVANVFARGWDRSASEAWTIRLEGPAGSVAIFDLQGRLVGLSGDGKRAVSVLDLARLQSARPPAPEGVLNAASQYWKASDLLEGPALELIRAGAKMETFDAGLGGDEMNRAEALSTDLAKLGGKLGGNIDDRVAGLKLARHLARAGRISFGIASADLLRKQCEGLFEDIPRMSQIQLLRLKAAIDGMGPDPAGIEGSVTGEVARTESIVMASHDIRSEIDMRMAALPILGPENSGELAGTVKALEAVWKEQRAFAVAVRSACSRPDLARLEDLLKIQEGPGALAGFPALRTRAFKAMTAQQAVRIAIKLREARIESGAYPLDVPEGMEDPATGRPFTIKKDGRGVLISSPDGDAFRLRD